MAWKHMEYHTNKSDISHTRLKQEKMNNPQIALVSPSKNTGEKEKEKKNKNMVTI